MGRSCGKPNLLTEQKARIAGMVDAGMSNGRVAKAVGLGQTTVSVIVPRSRTRGTVETAKKSGRPRLNDDPFFGITKIPIVFLRSSGTKAVDYIDQVYKGRLVDTLATIDPNH
ncbi:hypothetical protein MJO28_003680 [Puccinia striiformis f. sp. tritici]|uniref:Uncharacterized protein n=1 Tax=Puccinia striiformis f. sp. tritici TaxID=168172 RepID=A0ACC0EMZ0_9BASI|nr:hypothetical protein MJO28_003680 [Puccinia striiformis f. sp. tritici]